MKAKVRGIYTTALTKLLLENNFQIVQPSAKIRERFNLKDLFDPPDINIKDRYDLQGIHVMGTAEAVHRFTEILHSNFEDVITRKWKVSVDGIYKGKIVEARSNAALIDIGVALGKLLVNKKLEKQDEIVVQVERRKIGARTPLLTTNIKIIGKYAILTSEQNVGVSLKIRNLHERARLYALGKQLKPERWGIIWRETAVEKPTETLAAEVSKLVRKAEQMIDRCQKTKAPALLLDGLYCMDVEFPSSSKTLLDQLRATVTPTLAGHHHYKACGGRVSSILEMAEKMLEKGESRAYVENEFKRTVEAEYPVEGDSVQIEHVKPSGRVFLLGEAVIEEIGESTLRFQRILKRNGIYDGLRVPKQAGDRAVTEAEIGAWSFKTRYYSPSGEYKGTYININTPIELYPNAIRYVDLEVDICLWPDKTYKVLDENRLEKALNNGWISRKLAEHVQKNVEEIVEKLGEEGFSLKE